jgi:hypothetical protein
MTAPKTSPFRLVLPLPAFILHPLTAVLIASAHIYLAAGHLLKLFGGEVTWTNIWKGFGALVGAYVFVAVASQRIAQNTKAQHFGLGPFGRAPQRGSATEQ